MTTISHEKALLNEAQADYDANPAAGAPWPEVEKRLRRRSENRAAL